MKQTKNRWQEIEIKVHNLAEIDIPGFWQFLDAAIDSFQEKLERKKLRIDGETPWAKLGKVWHYARKGFPAGKDIQWEPDVLEGLQKTLEKVLPEGEFHWKNKQVVHLFRPDEKSPVLSIKTKKADGLWLEIPGPKDGVTVGQVADLGSAASIQSGKSRDTVKLSFNNVSQVANDDLESFLLEQVGQERRVG